MVEAVRRTPAGGLTVVTARRAAAERCARNVSSAVVASSRPGARRRARRACYKSWQVGSFFAACSGVFEAAGFSRGCGTLLRFA